LIPAWPASRGYVLFLTLCITATAQNSSPRIDFGQKIAPLLKMRCSTCHSREKRSGGLSLATYEDVLNGGRSGAILRPGDSGNSLVIRRLSGEVQPQMPFGGPPLHAEDIQTIRDWIDQGARETPTSAAAKPKWEAPLALRAPAIPKPAWAAWSQPVDRYVSDYLAAAGQSEPETVSDAIFARRAYLDIWGLLPDPNALRSFIASKAPGKRKTLVERLLADNTRYAENWISYWNDLLRNDEGVTYHSETASRKSITNWLLNALETNLPYDRFVSQLLDPAGPNDPEGFLIGVNWRGVVSASQTPAMQAAQNTAQVFLGINLKCNSCHDSFISRWKLKDAYSLASYFSPEAKLELYRCDVAQHQFAEPAFLYPEVTHAPASLSSDDRRSAIAATFTDPRNGRLARTVVNRIWLRLMGHGLVENPDDMDGEPWNPALLDWLGSDFVAHNYDLKQLIATIMESRAYQMPSIARKQEATGVYPFRGPEVRRLTAEQFADAIGAITGEWHVYQPTQTSQGAYTREWRVASTSLTRALGRPIRDQVFTTREDAATTLQGLELVNGASLTHWLARGSRKMLGLLPAEPKSLFDQPMHAEPRPASVDVDISGSHKLWLLVQDTGSYSPEKVEAIWSNAELVGPNGTVPLSSLKPADESGYRAPATGSTLHVKAPSTLIYDLGSAKYTRLRATAGFENREFSADISPSVRFFVFNREPNFERLTPLGAEAPLPPFAPLKSSREVIDRVFWYALGRAPLPEERSQAEAALIDPKAPHTPCADGLADLLWAVLMKPEFQLIY
jgi:hypothetical protein